MGFDNRMFAEGKVGKILLKFAVPAIISLFVSELYNMVDTFYVGRYVGANAIGALTIAFPVQRLLISIGLLIAIGASTAVARSLGENDYNKLKQTINNAFILTIMLLIIVPITVFIFKEHIITKLGASEAIYPYAESYISIVLIGGLFQSLTVVACYIMTALGNTKITLVATSIGAICNTIIDYIFVVSLSMGVKGAAISTVISQIIAFLFMVYKFSRVKKALNLKLKFEFNFNITKAIVAIGFSTFIVEISDAVVAVLLNNLVSVHGGDSAIIIVGVVSRLSMFLFITVIGISSAMQPIAAYNYGAKNYKRLKEIVKKAIYAVSVTSTILWALMMIFTRPIIGSFLQDQSLLNEAVKAFRMCIAVFPVVGLYYVAIYFYQSIEEARSSLILSVYRQLILFIPIVIVLVNLIGVSGAWIAFPISDLISAVTGFYYIKKAGTLLESEREAYIREKETLNFS
ncbi:MATE family efflux transporter [Clostridium senegalense]|uniref:MATE family efflux transporter n=1 Tax=Clostridium senegalense TaxID=1465809 RepID=UPI00028822F9|nr:MATE family efflux transporter [Clostridium senegalense]